MSRETNPYERMTEEEMLAEVREAALVLVELLKPGAELKQALQNEAVLSIIATNHKDDSELSQQQKNLTVSMIFTALEPFYADEDFENTRRGILTEVCANLTFERLGFNLLKVTSVDDLLGAIDILADPKFENGTILAIQVKGNLGLEEPVFERLDIAQRNMDTAVISREQFQKAIASEKKMLTYLAKKEFARAHPDLADRPVIPILIRIPTGERLEEVGGTVSAYNRCGEPAPGFENQLYDKMAETMGWDEPY